MTMEILNIVSEIRGKVKDAGNYRALAENSGVGYEWLCKFSRGVIKNPTVDNISKLQNYFSAPK